MAGQGGVEKEELDVLQADIDDESPQVLGALIDRALREGALDAHLAPLIMKRGRPAVRVEVLCRPEDRERFVRFLLTETSTLGVKCRRVERYALRRHFDDILLHGERVRVKIALLDGRPIRATPEFEDCRNIAEKKNLPLKTVLEEARHRCRLFVEGE